MVQEVRPSFSTLLKLLPKDELIIGVEIGVDRGENARRMLEASSNLKLYLVDIRLSSEVLDIIKEYYNRVEFIHKTSAEASGQFVNGFFDYIYIDGNHDYENVIQDIKSWYPKLKENGRIAGHDYGQEGVIRAVTEFVKETDKHICIERLDWWLK